MKSKIIQWIKSRNRDIVEDKINKEESSPSLRCVHCPKVEIFVKMFCANLQTPVWSHHVGVSQWNTSIRVCTGPGKSGPVTFHGI